MPDLAIELTDDDENDPWDKSQTAQEVSVEKGRERHASLGSIEPRPARP